MGAYNSTYIGVFLEVPIETKEVNKTILKNSNGNIFKSGKFDPNTGEPLIEETITEKVKCYPNTWLDDDCDTFWTPEYHKNSHKLKYFLLSSRNKFSQTIEESETFEIDEIDIKALIEEFKRVYSHYLDYYSHKGYNFKVKWGIVNYAN